MLIYVVISINYPYFTWQIDTHIVSGYHYMRYLCNTSGVGILIDFYINVERVQIFIDINAVCPMTFAMRWGYKRHPLQHSYRTKGFSQMI